MRAARVSRGTSRPTTSVGRRSAALHSRGRSGTSVPPACQSRRPHDALAVVRVHLRRGTRIAGLQETVCNLRVAPVVEPLPARPRAREYVGRQAYVGQRRLEPETGAADDDGGPAGRDDLVDRLDGARQHLELADGALAVERPDADETRTGVLVREDRKPW